METGKRQAQAQFASANGNGNREAASASAIRNYPSKINYLTLSHAWGMLQHTMTDRRIEELLEVKDVADLAACSLSWVRFIADDGRLPMAATTPRGTRLFRRGDVEVFLRQRRRGLPVVT